LHHQLRYKNNLEKFAFYITRNNKLCRRDFKRSNNVNEDIYFIALENISEFVKKKIKCGIFGPVQVLSCLGENALDIFCHLWSIPPIFPSAHSAFNGFSIKTLCGVSVDSSIPLITSKMSKSIDNDVGKIITDGLLELEVVIKIDYENENSIEYARKIFANEVTRSCEYMLLQSFWKIHNIHIDIESFRTKNIFSSIDNYSKLYLFSAKELYDDVNLPSLLGK
jgi:hypothetical protein